MSGSEWQDERLPEDVLSNSAIKSPYANPWEMLARPEETAPLASSPHPWLTFKTTLVSHVSKIHHHLSNLYVGHQEKNRRLKGLPPSPRALQEGLQYYAGLYQSKAPNAKVFLEFLQRNGVPDWANPYSESSVEHYQYHPLGFLAADVDYLLQALEQDWEKEEKDRTSPTLNSLADTLEAFPGAFAPPPAQPDVEKKWPSLYDSQIEHEKEIEEIQRQWRDEARLCWALVLVFADQQEQQLKKQGRPSSAFSHLKKEVHPDNLWLITVDVYQHCPETFQGISKDSVKKAAQRLGFGMGLDLTPSSDSEVREEGV